MSPPTHPHTPSIATSSGVCVAPCCPCVTLRLRLFQLNPESYQELPPPPPPPAPHMEDVDIDVRPRTPLTAHSTGPPHNTNI